MDRINKNISAAKNLKFNIEGSAFDLKTINSKILKKDVESYKIFENVVDSQCAGNSSFTLTSNTFLSESINGEYNKVSYGGDVKNVFYSEFILSQLSSPKRISMSIDIPNFPSEFKRKAILSDNIRASFAIVVYNNNEISINSVENSTIWQLAYDKIDNEIYFTTENFIAANSLRFVSRWKMPSSSTYTHIYADIVGDSNLKYVSESNGSLILSNVPSTGPSSQAGISIINLQTQISYDFKHSRGRYDKFNNINHVDRNIKDNMLISFQPYEIVDGSVNLNILPLKNFNTIDGRSTPTNPFEQFGEYSQSHRKYSGIDISDNSISLLSTYNMDSVDINEGYNTFDTPNTLYPFNEININDASFITKSGISGSSPSTSDRINVSTEDQFVNSLVTLPATKTQYLCTWLYDDNGSSKWMDRYALTGEHFNLNAILSQTIQYTPYDETGIATLSASSKGVGFIDVVSNFSILPSKTYSYNRISKINANSIVGKSIWSNTFNSDTDPETFNINSHNVGFSLELSSIGKANIGHQIIGNLTANAGTGIIADMDVQPYSISSSGKDIIAINYNGHEIARTTVPENILGIITNNDATKGHLVICENNVYKLDSDLSIIGDSSIVTSAITLERFSPLITSNIIGDDVFVCICTKTNNIAYRINFSTLSIINVSHITAGLVNNPQCLIYENSQYRAISGTKIAKIDNAYVGLYDDKFVYSYDIASNKYTNIVVGKSESIVDFTIDHDNNIIVVQNSKVSTVKLDKTLISTVSSNEYKFFGAVRISTYRNKSHIKDIKFKVYKDNMSSIISLGDTPEFVTRKDWYEFCGNIYPLIQSGACKYAESTSISFITRLIDGTGQSSFYESRTDIELENIYDNLTHFDYNVDTIRGFSSLYIDGDRCILHRFDRGRYSVINTFKDRMTINSSIMGRGQLSEQFLRIDDELRSSKVIAKNVKVFDRARIRALQKMTYLSLPNKLDTTIYIPCGTRSMVEDINLIFSAGNMNASNVIDINIKGIGSSKLKGTIEQIIQDSVKESAEANTIIKGINYIENE